MSEEDALYFPAPPGEREEMELLLELSSLALVSECPARYAVLLLSSALNINQFKTGFNCHLSDSDINTVLITNQMKDLLSWNMPASKLLTMETVHTLISSCDNLRYDDANITKEKCSHNFQVHHGSELLGELL